VTTASTHKPTRYSLAWDDIRTSLVNVRFWATLAWVDIVQRYRGSILGPFWLTISTAAFISGIGPLYSLLFGLELRDYLPYLASGVIVWNLILSTVNDSCSTFINAGPLMKQMRIPRMAHVFHLITRHVIIFAHSIPLFFVVHAFLGLPWGWQMLWAIPGFILLTAILTNVAIIFAIISVRFRDFIQVVASVMQISFFLTPVIWHVGERPALRLAADLNPLAALIALIRAPLLLEPISPAHIAWAVGGVVVLSAISFLLFARYRRRIIFWV
jgi:ABC-type polysaccharide/polyol phosphate export permease